MGRRLLLASARPHAARCGRWCCSTASPAGAGRSSGRPTTAWSTASARSTSAHLLLDADPAGASAAPERPHPRGGADDVVGSWLPTPPTTLRRPPARRWRGPRRRARRAPSARSARAVRRRMVDLLVRDEVMAAPRSSINVPIGRTRQIAVVRASLDELKAVKNALGGTVNDAVLAAATGGLRAPAAGARRGAAGGGPARDGPGQRPRATPSTALGNKVLSLFVHLPVAVADPLVRYDAVVADTGKLKRGSQAAGAGALVDLTGLAPPVAPRRARTHAVRDAGCSTSRSPTCPARPSASTPSGRRWSRSSRSFRCSPTTRSESRSCPMPAKSCFGLNADRDAVPGPRRARRWDRRHARRAPEAGPPPRGQLTPRWTCRRPPSSWCSGSRGPLVAGLQQLHQLGQQRNARVRADAGIREGGFGQIGQRGLEVLA